MSKKYKNLTRRPKTFWNIPQHPKTSQNIPTCPKTSQNIPKRPRASQNVPKHTNHTKCPKMSENAQKRQKIVQKPLITSKNLPKCPKMFKNGYDIFFFFLSYTTLHETLSKGKFFRDSRTICTIKAFQIMKFERRDDSKLHLYIGFC